MSNLTIKDMEYISKEYTAFKGNLDSDKTIVLYRQKHTGIIYIYIDTKENVNKYDLTQNYVENTENNYIYFVHNTSELKGWLYGVVQTKNGIL